MIDESARATGACAVHALVDRGSEEGDFGIFAAQFDGDIGFGDDLFDGMARRDDFLTEVEMESFGDANASAPRHFDRHGRGFELCANVAQNREYG